MSGRCFRRQQEGLARRCPWRQLRPRPRSLAARDRNQGGAEPGGLRHGSTQTMIGDAESRERSLNVVRTAGTTMTEGAVKGYPDGRLLRLSRKSPPAGLVFPRSGSAPIEKAGYDTQTSRRIGGILTPCGHRHLEQSERSETFESTVDPLKDDRKGGCLWPTASVAARTPAERGSIAIGVPRRHNRGRAS